MVNYFWQQFSGISEKTNGIAAAPEPLEVSSGSGPSEWVVYFGRGHHTPSGKLLLLHENIMNIIQFERLNAL